MKAIIQKCIFIQMFLIQAILAINSIIGWSNPTFTNKKILGSAMDFVQQRSKIKCVDVCHRTAMCRSVAFREDTKQCALYNRDFIDKTDVAHEPENSWKYFCIVPYKAIFLHQTSCTQYPGSNDRPCSFFCMKFVSYSTKKTIDTAEAECAAMDGELVRVDRELKEHCVKMLLDSVTDGEVLIQGRKIDGVWRYDDGTEITFFNWNTASNQPSNGATEDHMGIRKTNSYLWHDFGSGLKSFVCDIN